MVSPFETNQGSLRQTAIPLLLLRSWGSKGVAGSLPQAYASTRCSRFCTASASTETVTSTCEQSPQRVETHTQLDRSPLRPSHPGIAPVGGPECKPQFLSRTLYPRGASLPALGQQPHPLPPTVAQDPCSGSFLPGGRALRGAGTRAAICKHAPRALSLSICMPLSASEDAQLFRKPSGGAIFILPERRISLARRSWEGQDSVSLYRPLLVREAVRRLEQAGH